MGAATNRTSAPGTRAVAIYALSVPLAWSVTPPDLPWELVATGLAVTLVPFAGLGPWWMAINAAFLPALSAALTLELSPYWPLAAFGCLLLLYGRIWRSRVPLFFSTAPAQQTLATLLPPDRPIAFLDVGCGDGRVLARLAADRPESRFDGIEHALAPWFAARLRLSGRKRQCNVTRGNLWTHTLSPYDVVYAFLSPAVMEHLWEKARREMRPGTLLVSAFVVPNVAPDEQIEVCDALRTRLYVWRMGLVGRTS